MLSENNNKITLFITGAAGYVGAMLADQFSERDDVEKIICLDKEPKPELLDKKSKIFWIQKNMSSDDWQNTVCEMKPDIVVHCAWQIREMYGKKKKQWKWNVDGSNNVFDFVFSCASVKKIIHFSTVSSYGAFPTNTLDNYFVESDSFLEDKYLYGIEKKVVEKNLKEKFEAKKEKGTHVPQVFIVRPAAITGPRGRYMRVRFGLQSALSGQLKDSFIHRIISLMVTFVPITKKWVRQFIHEDDVVDIVKLFSFSSLEGEYNAFNICPSGEPVYGKDMAKVVKKKILPVTPSMIRFVFFWAWHISRGRVPTSRGGWKFYSYPVLVDGSKLTKKYNYNYKHNSRDAFEKTDGRYEKYINI